jgi:Zn-dependent alcohol dehydrogenase
MSANSLRCVVTHKESGLGPPPQLYAGRRRLLEKGRRTTTVVCVDAPPIGEKIEIAPAALFTVTEKKLVGCVLGSSNSLREIPRLVALWRAGRLDLEALITERRPLAEINQAMADLRAGRGVRTVLSI